MWLKKHCGLYEKLFKISALEIKSKIKKINKISIVIRAKNEEKYINSCLKKFLNKINLPFEVILVYDGRSKDKTLEIVQKFCCQILHTKDYLKKFSFGAALNLGIKHAQREIIALLSADAIPLSETWLSRLIKPFFEKNNLAGVYGRHLPRRNCFPWKKKDIELTYPIKEEEEEEEERSKFSNSNAAILKNVWQKVNFDKSLPAAEDIKWRNSVINKGYQIKYQLNAAVIHSHNRSLSKYLKLDLIHGKAYNELKILKPSLNSTNLFIYFSYLILLPPRLFKSWFQKIIKDKNYYKKNNIGLKWRLISPIFRLFFFRILSGPFNFAKKMKIGFISGLKKDWPVLGGASVHAFQITSCLQKLGHSIFSFDFEKNPSFKKYPFSKEGIKKFFKNIDLLYLRIHGSFKNEKYTLLAKKYSRPIIWEINSPLEEGFYCFKMSYHKSCLRFPFSYIKRRLKLSYENYLRKKISKLVDGTICVSNNLKYYSENYLNIKNSFHIPNGSDPLLFSPQKKDETLFPEYKDYFKIIWAGDARWPWQGISLILKIAQKLIKEKIIFILITDPKYIKKTKNIIVIKPLPYFEIPKYFASADLGLVIYHDYNWCKWKFYGSPLKLFDIMASGIPAIVSDIGGQINEVVQDKKNGLLTNNSTDDISSKILFIKNNPLFAQKIGFAARKSIINYYNWQRAAKETIKVFKMVIDNYEKS